MKATKTGLSTAVKYQDRPMEYELMTVKERTARHLEKHPNDKNKPSQDKGVQWAKSRKTDRDKKLADFYKTHIYTWISENRRGWVEIPKTEEEE